MTMIKAKMGTPERDCLGMAQFRAWYRDGLTQEYTEDREQQFLKLLRSGKFEGSLPRFKDIVNPDSPPRGLGG